MTPEQAYDWLAPKLSKPEREALDVIYRAAPEETTPLSRSRKALEGVNVRQVLEASNLPVEIATAIADALETVKPEVCSKCGKPFPHSMAECLSPEGRLAKWKPFDDYMPPDGCVFIPPEKAHLPIILNDKAGNYWICDPLLLPGSQPQERKE